MSLKDEIIKLRTAGLTYLEIKRKLNCSKSIIAYHLGNGVKTRQAKRQWRNRTKASVELKTLHGGKCRVCGYSKCFAALEFHHLDPTTKISELSNHSISIQVASEEAKKCVLLCANCHREHHNGMLDLSLFTFSVVLDQ
jgi:hypothetical protein